MPAITPTHTLIAALLLGVTVIVTRSTRYRLWRAAHATLRYFPAAYTRGSVRRLLTSRDGLAVLLLLCNTAAKQHPRLYRYKVLILHATVAATALSDWWIDEHTHKDASTYTDTMIIFIETTVGPILDIPRVQLSAHVSKADAARFFPNAPQANGRRWAGIALQPRAAEIAAAFIQRG